MNYDYSDISTDGIRNVINGRPNQSRDELIEECEELLGCGELDEIDLIIEEIIDLIIEENGE